MADYKLHIITYGACHQLLSSGLGHPCGLHRPHQASSGLGIMRLREGPLGTISAGTSADYHESAHRQVSGQPSSWCLPHLISLVNNSP